MTRFPALLAITPSLLLALSLFSATGARAADDGDAHPIALDLASRCSAGEGEACYGVALAALMSKDTAAALAPAKKACAAGIADACALEVVLDGADDEEPDLVGARAQLEEACAGGSVVGCTFLGTMLAMGEGGEADPARAEVILDEACERGMSFACIVLADLVRAQGPEGEHRARILIEGQCDKGFVAACWAAFQMHQEGVGGEGHPERVFRTATGFCEAGADEGCVLLAGLLLKADMDLPPRLDLRGELDRHCGDGHAASCRALGDLWKAGVAGPADRQTALRQIERACEAGDRDHCHLLASTLRKEPDALPGSMGEFEAYRRACDPDHARACHNLAVKYATGDGVPEDQGAAREAYRLGCEGGIWESCAQYAWFQRTGTGGPELPDRARSLYSRGCAEGHPDACAYHASMNEMGEGGPANRAQAIEDFGRACTGGLEWACDRLELLREE